jgi:alpha-amylase
MNFASGLLFLTTFACLPLSAQESVYHQPLEDSRVMLQGFYWESYRHGNGHLDSRFASYGTKRWYEIVASVAGELKSAKIDVVWLPPPSFAGKLSAGYNPKELFRLDNSYGDMAQHVAMLQALQANGIEPLADLVLNHRSGSSSWADFKNPDWGPQTVVREDVVFSHERSPWKDTPLDQRGAPEDTVVEYAPKREGGRAFHYPSFRNIDHNNAQVRQDVVKFLLGLRKMGYRGWRWDMCHGFHARHVAFYNAESRPTLSIGEYDWGALGEQRGWAWHTAGGKKYATGTDQLSHASMVFDFQTKFALQNNKSSPGKWANVGLLGDRTSSLPWKAKAVTFLENHDTGFRTGEDGKAEHHHESDSFAQGKEVSQGYAYILTHPGLPCVYWKHYFDWGAPLRKMLRELIALRKQAGVHAASELQVIPGLGDATYAAVVTGRRSKIIVEIGEPAVPASALEAAKLAAAGEGWRVWLR